MNIIQEDSSKGCILEVDFGYRLELHNLHNNYPLVFEKKLSQRQYAVWLLQKKLMFVPYLSWWSNKTCAKVWKVKVNERFTI